MPDCNFNYYQSSLKKSAESRRSAILGDCTVSKSAWRMEQMT